MSLVIQAGQQFLNAFGLNSVLVFYISAALGIMLIGLGLSQLRK